MVEFSETGLPMVVKLAVSSVSEVASANQPIGITRLAVEDAASWSGITLWISLRETPAKAAVC